MKTFLSLKRKFYNTSRILFFFCIMLLTDDLKAQFTYPIDMEGTYGAGQVFNPFGGTTVAVVDNPDLTNTNCYNRSDKVLRIDKGNQPWAGMEFRAATAIPAGTFGAGGTKPNFCFDYYTTAPIGSRILFKFNGFPDMFYSTTVSGEWSQACFTPPATTSDWPVIIFRLNDMTGYTAGNANWRLFVDNLNFYANGDIPAVPLAFTAGSQYFVPPSSVSFTLGSPGDWYANPTGGTILAGGTNTSTWTTPILSEEESYWVDLGTSTTLTNVIVGPTTSAYTLGNPAWWGRQKFISNFEDGALFHGVSMTNRRASPGVNINGSNCNWQVCARNLTNPAGDVCAVVNGLTDNPPGAIGVFNFTPALSMDNGDEIEVDFFNLNRLCAGCNIAANYGCAITPLLNSTYTPYPNTTDPEVTWTYHRNGEVNTAGGQTSYIQGFNYRFSGDLADPRVQINAVFDCPAILPVDLIKFTAIEERGDAILTWVTASETNNDYFIIRKTKDGVNFENIGTMKGAGTTSTMSQYSFTDTNLGPDLTYYQIVQVDYDGKKSESWLVSLDKEMSANYNIFPNPTDGVFTLSKTINVSEEIEIEIKDLAGRTIEHYNLFGSKPLFKEIFNIHDYPSGVYTLIVSSRNQRDVLKLIKQ
jgi:hypothetical protein